MMTEVAGSEYTVDVDLVLIAAGSLKPGLCHESIWCGSK